MLHNCCEVVRTDKLLECVRMRVPVGGAITLSKSTGKASGVINWIGLCCFIAISQLWLKAHPHVCVCLMRLLSCCLLPRKVETPHLPAKKGHLFSAQRVHEHIYFFFSGSFIFSGLCDWHGSNQNGLKWGYIPYSLFRV